jgi:MFS family permease
MIANEAIQFAAQARPQYSARRSWLMLAVLFGVATCSYLDRHIIAVLLEPIKKEFGVSDTLLGLLTGFAFAIFYATLGIPVARWADRGNRRLVITLSLLAWSTFTALCGVATSFWQLAVMRVGVGAGEAGAIPPSQSLLVDYFPPEKRSTVLAIFISSATLGYLVAFVGGAALAQHFGWRIALIAVGLPGLLLAVIAHFTLDEPRMRQKATALAGGRKSSGTLWSAIGELKAKKSYVWALGGAASYGLVAYGAMIFMPSFMVRSLHVSLAEVGVMYGGLSAVSALVTTLLGGWLADKLGKRDVRWYAWLPAAACALAFPFQILSMLSNSFTAYLVWSTVSGLFIGVGIPSMFTALHAVCGSKNRSLAVAIFSFTMSLIGSGLGPLITGAISDAFKASAGVESLRYAIMIASCFFLPAAGCLYRCAQGMLRDLED